MLENHITTYFLLYIIVSKQQLHSFGHKIKQILNYVCTTNNDSMHHVQQSVVMQSTVNDTN